MIQSYEPLCGIDGRPVAEILYQSQLDEASKPESDNPIMHKRLRDIEVSYFNRASHITVLSTFSGIAQFALGLLELMVGLTIALKEASLGFFTTAKLVEYTKHFNEAEQALEGYVAHGLANMGRGLISIIPIIGNIATIIYDLASDNRMAYKLENDYSNS